MRGNQYELLDMLTSLLNLTIIEDAPRTNELLSSFIDYIKYKYMEKSTFVHISGELEHAEQYLLFQKKRRETGWNIRFRYRKTCICRRCPPTY